MFRIVQSGYSLPFSFPVDPSAEFNAGQVGQLYSLGNNIVCGVSNGTAPIGILDDVKTRSFSTNSIDEVVVAGPIVGVRNQDGNYITPVDVKVELQNPNVNPSSFVTKTVDCELIPRNGVVVFLAGTVLNIDLDGDGIPDGIRTVVSYSYTVPNIPGDDSTIGSGRVTIWFSRIIFQTDQFDTTADYPLNSPLFIDECGKFTTRQISTTSPGVAIITAPPVSVMGGTIEALWL